MPRVIVEKRFRQFGEAMTRDIKVSLTEAGAAGAQAAQEKETREKTGELHSGIHARPVEWLPGRGYIVAIVSEKWYTIFQDIGTLAKRKRKLKASTLRRRETGGRYAKVEGRGGIKGLHFMAAGKRAGQTVLMERLRENFPRR